MNPNWKSPESISDLPPALAEIRRKMDDMSFRFFMNLLEDERRFTSWDVARIIHEQTPLDIPAQFITLWRSAFLQYKPELIPPLAEYRAPSPLVCVYPTIEEEKDNAA